jgi:hypothetical protein
VVTVAGGRLVVNVPSVGSDVAFKLRRGR